MRLPIFHVDAFTGEVFRGNPAAVVPLERWLPDHVMQAIAAENNLAETAFYVPVKGEPGAAYHIRWWTPTMEVALCGHATLGTGHVLREHLGIKFDRVAFKSRSGILAIEAGPEGRLVLDFPAMGAVEQEAPSGLAEALGIEPRAVFEADQQVNAEGVLMCLLESERDVHGVEPDFAALKHMPGGCVVITAPGDECDFVSRFFAPGAGIDEDPVTGSTHCLLAPFWAARLGKKKLRALQVSRRGGELLCEVIDKRVRIAGRAVTYLKGEIEVPG